jgi:hypothetical protein
LTLERNRGRLHDARQPKESSMVEFIGWVFVVLGILFLVLGLIEGFRKLKPENRPGPEGVIEDLIGALIKAGLLNVAIGLVLVTIGLRMLGYDVFPASTK